MRRTVICLLTVLTLGLQGLQSAASEPAAPGPRIRDVLLTLSPAGRKIFMQDWLRVERIEGPTRKAALNSAQDRALATMVAEPFNAEALRQAYADQRTTAFNNQKARQERLVSILAHLSPEDRRLVVRQLQALHEHQVVQ